MYLCVSYHLLFMDHLCELRLWLVLDAESGCFEVPPPPFSSCFMFTDGTHAHSSSPTLFPFSPSSPPFTALCAAVLLYTLPCPVSAPSHCLRFSRSVFFLLPAPLALPPGHVGTVMFMKPFNVLCNYPGNTSHHYSCQ